MFRRVLAFVMAGLLVFESAPVTSYATTLSTETVSENSETAVSENVGSMDGTDETEEEIVTDVEEITDVEESGEEKIEVTVSEDAEVTEPIEYNAAASDVSMNTLDVDVSSNTLNVEAFDEANGNCIYTWYSFTAPKAGYYGLNMTNEGTGSAEISVYESVDSESYLYQTYVSSYEGATGSIFLNDELTEGETVYICTYSYSSVDTTLNLVIKYYPIWTLEKQEDESYTVSANELQLTVIPKIGYETICSDVSMNTLDEDSSDSYYIGTHCVSDSHKTSIGQYFYSNSARSTVKSSGLNMGQEYELYYVVDNNTTGNAIGVFKYDKKITTLQTDEKVIIYNTSATTNEITIEYELFENCSLYYSPTDGSGQEDIRNVYTGWNTITVDDLFENTEYSIQFKSQNTEEVLYQTTIKTADSGINAEYQITVSDGFEGIYIKGQVSNYTGNCLGGSGDEAYVDYRIRYEFVDAFGVKQESWANCNLHPYTEDENGAKSFELDGEIQTPALLAGSTIDLTVSLEFWNEVSYVERQTFSITMPNAAVKEEDVNLEVTSDEETNGRANVSIRLDNITTSVATILYYRQQGSEAEYIRSNTLIIPDTEEQIYSIDDLEPGAVYEFLLFAGGVTKNVSATIGTATLKLTQIDDGEVNPFDIVRNFKIESTEELTGTYYLRMYYLDDWGEYTSWGSYYTLNADNSYECTYKTADNSALKSNTEYKLKWTLSTSSYSSSKPEVTFYEKVTTEKANLSFVPDEACYNAQKYTVSLDSEDVANFTNKPSFSIEAHIRKEGDEEYRYISSVYLSNYNSYSGTLTFTGLEAATNYEVSMRDNDDNEYEKVTFATTDDNRTITVNSITSSFHSADVNVTVSNYGAEDALVCAFIRQKGTEDEWELVNDNFNYWNNYNTGTIDIDNYKGVELAEDTTYELTLGLNTNWSSDITIEDLEKVITTEFTTKKDMRTVSGGTSAGYASAKLQAYFSGNDSNIWSYIHYFYRAKGAEEWIHYAHNYTSSVSGTYSITVTDLTAGTNYDYAIVISDRYSCNGPDEVTNELRKVVGEFTTKSNTYTLDFAVNDEKTTNDKAVVAVTAKGDAGDSRVDVTLTLSNGQTQKVTLRQSTGYTKNVTFKDLIGSTEYTITKAAFSVEENDNYVEIGEIACNYKFTTKEAEVPTAIALAEEKIVLNAVYANSTLEQYDGIGYQAIKAEVTPATAADDFVYTSSDETVATVDANGVVYAKNAGTATITVASAYDANVKATCTVEVKKYAIGQSLGNGSVSYVEINPYYPTFYHVYKGNALEGYGLYEMTSDTEGTLLSDFAVSFDRENIATWSNGNIQSVNVGETGVIFEKDGVKAKMLVSVTAAGKGFGITGFSTSDTSYPAIQNADGSYTLVNFTGVTYEAIGAISPSNYFNPTDFTWSVSDETIASVNEYGVITPKADGTVTLTVTPVNYYAMVPYIQDKVEVVLNIKGLPMTGNYDTIYALTNECSKIGEVKFPESWGEGWNWKYPDTPLVTNGVNSSNSYYFEAVYNGNNGYPIETELLVYIGKITGAYVYETGGNHNNVVEVNDTDSIRISVMPAFQGLVTNGAYTVEIPAVDGLTITKASDFYTITAQKAGKYTLQPVIKIGDKVVATTKYTINAVSEKQVANIQFTSDTEGVIVDGNKIIFDSVENKKDFALKATVTDRQGEILTTALQWKTSDKKVAAVTADKANTQNAKVVTKESGHATIVVKAKDATGYQVELDVEVQDHSPRVDTNKATVNIAYDYDNWDGRNLASGAGLVEIVPVYGEYISSIQVLDKAGEKAETNLELISYDGEYRYLVKPTQATIPTGKYSCTIRVTTSEGRTYDYPLNVTVVEKTPKVTAKKCSTINLFFTETTGTINLKVTNNARISSVSWVDKSEGVGNGFSMTGYYYTRNGKYVNYVSVTQEDGLAVVNGALQDTGVAEGTLTVKLAGYRESYTFENVKVNTNYKKPTIVTQGSSSNVIPSIGQTNEDFGLYDKTNKRWLYYNYDYSPLYTFEEIECEDEDITLWPGDNSAWVSYQYSGDETRKITLDLDSSTWREPLQTTHTIKVISPKAYLGTKQLTYNNAVKNTLDLYVYLSGTYNIDKYADMVISGANPKSQELLDKDLFVASFNGYNSITFKQSDASLMNTTIPKGTYSYKVTPYVKNVETGEKVALNTLTLKIKVVDKPVTAKVSPKGSIDLANGRSYSVYTKKNCMWIDPKFSNMVSGYSLVDYKLVGEYSDYFDIGYGYYNGWHYYIKTDYYSALGKLKAGQTYKLAIEYTLRTNDGDEITVTSNTFKIKPKQSKPKVTVGNNNQTLYAAADNVSRTYYLYVPSYYSIESAYGSIDCNKDGKADIAVTNSGGSYTTVRIIDKDAVIATTKGKSYSIPVTVRVTGRDGIAKDASVKIKVKVKR